MFEECGLILFQQLQLQVCLKTNSLWIVSVYLENYNYFS